MSIRPARGFVVEADGARFTIDLDEQLIELRAFDGTTRFIGFRDLGDLLDDRQVAFHCGQSFLIALGAVGNSVLRFSFIDSTFEILLQLKRTDLLEEGFDYVAFTEIETGLVLSYELGLVGLSAQGRPSWHTVFDELRVFPSFENNCAVYDEIEGIARYSLVTGGRET